ncbi:BtaA family protein [Desulfobulbus rhabdoformis]|jgi:S-adenosylmethionine-diacylglycerol 3-amino-3-carboxypropyl transferase|uniref:DUF3419 family protein n=1 Tax=Desulfobulbus rhabdoformis TaxID=34032 RepID=UPI001962EC65|nr:DUF3419 family protein [Desulfobulbus rhabdoformis]MBM9612806.1 BtaA family protein [Desulfobulbus rhabdoformis]
MPDTEIAAKASFTTIRYAQCWEDADILLQGLEVQEGDVCVGIGSAGDNCLSLLTKNPERVIAVDLNPAQLACIELRVAAFRCLSYTQLLELMGSRPSEKRLSLYGQCRTSLSGESRNFWDNNQKSIADGIGAAGKFEHYFMLFRKYIIPLIHSRTKVEQLLEGGSPQRCAAFYDASWDTFRWRMLFRLFFSRWMMGRLGRDPSFFAYVKGSVADKILERTRHALRDLDPGDNPYLHWILTGHHGKALPHALREEHFEVIRNNIDRLEIRLGTLESVLEAEGPKSVDRFNLSDIFEYMSEETSQRVLAQIVAAGRSGGRLAYWNMLAPRCCPPEWGDRVERKHELETRLLNEDKAFFYSAFIVEEIV